MNGCTDLPGKRSVTRPVLRDQTKSWELVLTLVLGIALTLILLVSAILFPGASGKLRNLVSDIQIGALRQPQPSSIPIIVTVDEKSLQAYGQWPWPRHLVAQLLEDIAGAGASAVGIDALFVERDRSSPTEMALELKRGFNLDLDLSGIPAPTRDYDKIFAEVLHKGPFVLSYVLDFEGRVNQDCVLKSVNTALLFDAKKNGKPWKNLPAATGALCSIPLLSEAVSAAGFINSRPYDDNIYRQSPLIAKWGNRIVPSLALQTYLTAKGYKQLVVVHHDNGFTLKIRDQNVPLDAAGNLLIRFRGPSRSYDYISAVDVLEGRVKRARLQDRIVFLGLIAAGLKEYRPIQYDPLFTGVEIHAAIVDNLLTGDFLRRPSEAQELEILFALIFGVLLSALLAWTGPLISALSPVLLGALAVSASQILLARKGILISPALTIATLISVLLILSLFKYGREKLKSEEIHRQILISQEATIEGFCAMSEYRDPETGGHIKRTQNYVRALAENLRNHPRFRDFLDDDTIELMYKTAPLHDVGKIGIPDHILLKPSQLNDQEFEIMKKHTEYGAQVFELIQKRTGENDFLRMAIEIILGHQEKWDGSGYPNGIAGDAIPLSARLMALADVYDALISRRVYKPPYPHDEAVRIIERGKGTHFDPDVVDAFLQIESEFKQLALRNVDNDEQREVLLREDGKSA